MKRLIFVLSLVVCVFLITSSVNAYVQNVTTGELLFYDTFQLAPNGVSHQFPDTTGDYDPVAMSAAPSAWAIIGEDAIGKEVQVTDMATPGPAPDFGPNYLRISRIAGMGGDAEAQFVGQATTGDHIKMAWWLNIPNRADGCELNLLNAGGAYINQIITNYGGASVWNSGDANHDTGLTFVADQWQKWEIDYNIDDPTFTLTIDGVSASGLGMGGPGSLGALEISMGATADPGIPMYVGEAAVPEPASVMLMLSGVIALLVCVWRKRK